MEPTTTYASFLKAEYASACGDAVQVAVRVVAVLPGEVHEGRPRRRLRLMDLETNRQETTPVCDSQVMQRAAAALRCGGVLVASGCFVEHGGTKTKPPGVRFQIDSLQPAPPPSTLLGGDAELMARTDRLLDQWIQEDSIFQNLCARSYELLGIDPTFSARYQQAIHLIALQALSQGQLPSSTNGRISACIFSMPSQGKKIFSQLAELWAPVAQAVQPTMLTPVGLSARAEPAQGGAWTTVPGAIPQCSGGVCIIDDYHRVPEKHLEQVEAILMSVMEDGRIVPVKAASASYQAATAMLLIANRRADAQGRRRGKHPGVVGQRLGELSLCGELLSRCDVLVELHTGEDPAEGAERQAGMDPPLEFDLPEQEEEARREVKLLVTRLRDRIKTVNLRPVRGAIKALMRDVALVVRDQCAVEGSTLDGDSLLRRMSNAVRKLTAAEARLHGRSVAEPADVAVAWEMMSLKLEVVGYICGRGSVAQPLYPREEQVQRAKAKEEARFLRLLNLSGGGQVTLEQAAQRLGMTVKQVGRELWKRGLRTQQGYLTLPTLEEYVIQEQQRVAEAERAAEAAARRGEALARVRAQAAAPSSPPIEFWRGPEPLEAPAVEQALVALREPPPGPEAVPALPRRFAEIPATLKRLPVEERQDAEKALVRSLHPGVIQYEVSSNLAMVKQSLMMGAPIEVAARVEEPLREMTRWVLEGGPNGGWALRVLAVLLWSGLTGVKYDLEKLLAQHPVEEVRAALRVVVARYEEEDRAAWQRIQAERRALGRDTS